jgi:hypothetical protein
VQPTSDGGYILTGSTETWAVAGSDLFIMKTDSLGYVSGVIEKPVTQETSNWKLISSIGQQVILKYSDCPQGFHAQVFDATGRRIDELHSTEQSGTIIWPVTHQSPGVYFIKQAGQTEPLAKVVLIR